jgi:hypothetical protein
MQRLRPPHQLLAIGRDEAVSVRRISSSSEVPLAWARALSALATRSSRLRIFRSAMAAPEQTADHIRLTPYGVKARRRLKSRLGASDFGGMVGQNERFTEGAAIERVAEGAPVRYISAQRQGD